MNRKLSGLFAWGALALIIAIPSSEIISSNSINNASINDNNKDLAEPFFQVGNKQEIQSSNPSMFGPIMPNNNTQNQRTPKTKIGTPIPIEFRIVGDQEIAVIKQGIRVVGDVGMATNISEDRLQISKRLSEKEKILSQNIEANIVFETKPKLQLALEHPLKVTNIKPPFLQQDNATNLPLYAEPIIKKQAVAPIPMPAIIRPTNNKIAVAQTLSDIKITNINNNQKLKKVDFYDLVAARTLTQNNDLQAVPQTTNRQRLDQINAQQSANQNEYFLYWQNSQRQQNHSKNSSFIEQLPAYRGNGIRLDLIN